ncbi:MAG: phosphatase PAP2-related protein [Planctomycetota bacterium]|nr:phosphatase PAP2-related protein [Planctomycetota bacterium]
MDSIRWRRLAVVVLGLGLWFLTQSLLGARTLPAGGEIAGQVLSEGDGLFRWSAPWHQMLVANETLADTLLICSSLVIDLIAIFIILSSVFGATMRPFLALLMLFMLRQICQGLSPLPAPTGMIWHHPGFPSLLVTYQVANDFFFSGHTAIAAIGATEMGRLGRRWWIPAVLVLLFEMATVIVLRAHYTMDVYAGIVSALLVAIIAARVAPPVDRWLAGSSPSPPTATP